MSGPQSLSERLQALVIANAWLDFKMDPFTQMIHGDPDCDACVVARQFLRAVEALDAQATEIALLKEGRTLHDEHADHLEHELASQSALLAESRAAFAITDKYVGDLQALLAQAAAALEQYGLHKWHCPKNDVPPGTKCICGFEEALAALRATLVEKVDD